MSTVENNLFFEVSEDLLGKLGYETIVTHEDKLTFYRLLETFSPIPLSDYPTKLISEKIEKHLYINNRYILNIPQFVISIEVNKIESTKYNNLNHSALWENII